MSDFRLEEPSARDWPTIAQLFADEYGTEPQDELRRLRNSLNPEDGARAVVARGDWGIVGFQSYMPWDVCQSGDRSRCFQSGNSIVAPAARGKGLFARLLAADVGLAPEGPLFGFPVSASFQAFVRDGWTAPFRLESFVRPVLGSRKRGGHDPRPAETSVNIREVPDGCTTLLCQEPPMRRRLRLGGGAAQTWQWHAEDHQMLFNFKRRRVRLKGLSVANLVQVGGVSTQVDSRTVLEEGVRSFTRMAAREYGTCLVEFAVNPLTDQWPRVLRATGFRWRPRAGCNFVVKHLDPYRVPWNRWWVFRGDHDSW